MDTTRRDFLVAGGRLLVLTSAAAAALDHVLQGAPEQAPTWNTAAHWWAMAIDIERCIGCGNCVRACKAENDVPDEPSYFRTWVERYHVVGGDEGASGAALSIMRSVRRHVASPAAGKTTKSTPLRSSAARHSSRSERSEASL